MFNPYPCAYACVVSSLCPGYFSSPATLRLPSTTLAIPSQPTHTGRESVDQWSPVVEQIAPIATVMNATSVHSLPRITPNPLSCAGLTPCVSSQSPEPSSGGLCQPHLNVDESHDSGQPTGLTQSGVPVHAYIGGDLVKVFWGRGGRISAEFFPSPKKWEL